MRVLVVILSLDREPWRSLEQAQRRTWVRNQGGVQFAYLQGTARSLPRSAFLGVRRVAAQLGLHGSLDSLAGNIGVRLPVRMEKNLIRTRTPEYWIGTSAKMHAGLRYIAENFNFDYLVRTNSSTYIHLPSLLAHLEEAPRSGYYAGADQGEPHAQGTLIVLSEDAMRTISAKGRWDYTTVDDAALGDAASSVGIPFVPLTQVILHDLEEVYSMPLDAISSNFIFRMKTRNDRLADADMLEHLHQRISARVDPR